VIKKVGRSWNTTAKKNVPQEVEDHPAFGMWADREDMKDPSAWVRRIRAQRYHHLGRRRPKP
jgi:hypothetical protein